MVNLSYSITPSVFEAFPGYCRGVVVVTQLVNGRVDEAITATLRDEEASLRSRLTVADLTQHPHIAAWRAAFQSQGWSPASSYRPSVEALARRVLQGHALPTISPIVDLANALSLRLLLPVGAHALEDVESGLELRHASGEETFLPMGGAPAERVDPGEIVFADGQRVLVRRWTWRQGARTLVQPSTASVEVNIDGLPPVSESEIWKASRLLESWVRPRSGSVESHVLTATAPTLVVR